MRLNQLKRVIAILEELELRQATLESDKGMHSYIKNYLIGACIECRTDLIERIKREHNLDLEV